jgi:hypothetical protein
VSRSFDVEPRHLPSGNRIDLSDADCIERVGLRYLQPATVERGQAARSRSIGNPVSAASASYRASRVAFAAAASFSGAAICALTRARSAGLPARNSSIAYDPFSVLQAMPAGTRLLGLFDPPRARAMPRLGDGLVWKHRAFRPPRRGLKAPPFRALQGGDRLRPRRCQQHFPHLRHRIVPDYLELYMRKVRASRRPPPRSQQWPARRP